MSEQRQDVTEEELEAIPDFEEKMKKRVNRDSSRAIEFMNEGGIREEWMERFRLYHRGMDYDKLRKQEVYPTDFYADQIDTFVASMMNPLWAKDEPCKLIPGPNTDPKAVEAKQKLHEYQNREDDLKTTERLLIHDIAINGFCIAKTDYVEKTERVWGTEEVPVTNKVQDIDPLTQQVIGEHDEPEVDLLGMPVMKPVSVPKDVPIYKGPHTERIDPQDFFFTVDKRRGDDNPIMIRSFVPKEFFDDKTYFFNQELILDHNPNEKRFDDDANNSEEKRRILKLQSEARSKNDHLYMEWQGKVDKKELFEYLGEKWELDERTQQMINVHDPALVKEGEKIMCICGVVDGETVVRLDKFPFLLDHPNIVIGIMEPIDNELVGNSIGQKLKPAALMLDKLAGVMFKALRVAVNRGHAINVMAVEGGASGVPDVNQDAWVLKTLDNPASVHKIIDQPSVAKDVYQAIALVQDWGRNRTGIQEISSGSADPDSETLGETEIVAGRASIRSSDPLEIIEDTLIIPVTRMRDEINQQFLTDPEYLMEVIGPDGARNWEPITPEQVRSHTRFMCESSGREFDRAVVTQQLLQANQIAPNALAAGQAVRLDRGLFQLFTDGFGRSEEEAAYWLPTVKVENETGSGEQMDQMMAQNQMLVEMMKNMQLQMQMLMPGMMMGGGMGGGDMGSGGGTPPGQELPQPKSEGEAADSAMEASRPDVGVM